MAEPSLFEKVTGGSGGGTRVPGAIALPLRSSAAVTKRKRSAPLAPTTGASVSLGLNPKTFEPGHPPIVCAMGTVEFEKDSPYAGLTYELHATAASPSSTKLNKVRVRISGVVYLFTFARKYDLNGREPVLDNRPYPLPRPSSVPIAAAYDDRKDKADRDYDPNDGGGGDGDEGEGDEDDDDDEAVFAGPNGGVLEEEVEVPRRSLKKAKPKFEPKLVRACTTAEKAAFVALHRTLNGPNAPLGTGKDVVCEYQQKYEKKMPQDLGYWCANYETRKLRMTSRLLPDKVNGPQRPFLWHEGDLWEFDSKAQMQEWWEKQHPPPPPPPPPVEEVRLPRPKRPTKKSKAADAQEKESGVTPPAAAAVSATATTTAPCSTCHKPMDFATEARRKVMTMYSVEPRTGYLVSARMMFDKGYATVCGDCDEDPPISQWDEVKYEGGETVAPATTKPTVVAPAATAAAAADDSGFIVEDDGETVVKDADVEDQYGSDEENDDADEEAERLKQIESMRKENADWYLRRKVGGKFVPEEEKAAVRQGVADALVNPEFDPEVFIDEWEGADTDPVLLIIKAMWDKASSVELTEKDESTAKGPARWTPVDEHKAALNKRDISDLDRKIAELKAAPLANYTTPENGVPPERKLSTERELKRLLPTLTDPETYVQQWTGRPDDPVLRVLQVLVDTFLGGSEPTDGGGGDASDTRPPKPKKKHAPEAIVSASTAVATPAVSAAAAPKKKAPSPIISYDTRESNENDAWHKKRVAELTADTPKSKPVKPSPPRSVAPLPVSPPKAAPAPAAAAPVRAAAVAAKPAPAVVVDSDGFIDSSMNDDDPSAVADALAAAAQTAEEAKGRRDAAAAAAKPAARAPPVSASEYYGETEYERGVAAGEKKAKAEIAAMMSCGVCYEPMALAMVAECGHMVCNRCKCAIYDSGERRSTCVLCQVKVKNFYKCYRWRDVLHCVMGTPANECETYPSEEVVITRQRQRNATKENFNTFLQLAKYHQDNKKNHKGVVRMQIVTDPNGLQRDLTAWMKIKENDYGLMFRTVEYNGSMTLEAFPVELDPATIPPPVRHASIQADDEAPL